MLDLCQPKPFLVHQRMLDPAFPHGWWYYVRSCDVAALSDAVADVVADVVADHGMQISSSVSSLTVADGRSGGPGGRGRDGLNGRQAGFTFNISGNSLTADGFDTQRQWARDFWSALAPHHTSVYVNFLM